MWCKILRKKYLFKICKMYISMLILKSCLVSYCPEPFVKPEKTHAFATI